MKAQMFNYRKWIRTTNPELIKQKYGRLLANSGFRILERIEHYFEPQGYTVIYLLAESHFAVHTFPEEGKSYIELSSCVKKQYKAFVSELSHKRGE